MTFDIYNGDALDMLRGMPDASVQMVVTSPPYWGLRDYGVAGQIGLEETPDAYTDRLVAVFEEVRRILKDDGTLWLNLGDSYQNAKGQAQGVDPKQPARRHGLRPHVTIPGLKPKDLVGIPWMVAFALRADGWYLRSDIIWAKPNPMPESVTDRPTRAHEYIFLLTKSKAYYYNADAIKEPFEKTGSPKHLAGGGGERAGTRGGLKREAWLSNHPDYVKPYEGTATKDYASSGAQDPSATKARIVQGILDGRITGRNKRTVWTVTPQPFKGAHFATFPEKLVEPCILAGSRPGDVVLDPFCGSGRAGVVALKHGREFLGIELNPEYVVLAVDALSAVEEAA